MTEPWLLTTAPGSMRVQKHIVQLKLFVKKTGRIGHNTILERPAMRTCESVHLRLRYSVLNGSSARKFFFQRERKGTPKEATDLRFVHSFDFRVAREGGIDDDQKLTDAL